MPGKLYGLGLGGACEPFKIILSDFNGADIIEELKAEISDILDTGVADGSPVPVYIMTGVLGAIRVEVLILYIYGGVPFILDPYVGIEGGGLRDGTLVRGGSFVGAMLSVESNRMAFSLGYVDSPDQAYGYAVTYTRGNPLVKNTGISDNTVALYLSSNSGSVTRVGSIQKLGGSLFDVFAFNNTESALIRDDKDFIGGEPDRQNGIRQGKYEVILFGGDPDIVQVGAHSSLYGDMFCVWVPNDARFIECAKNMLMQGDLPRDSAYVDYDDLADAYAMYASKLLEDERDADSAAEDDDVPDFVYSDDDEDESADTDIRMP